MHSYYCAAVSTISFQNFFIFLLIKQELPTFPSCRFLQTTVLLLWIWLHEVPHLRGIIQYLSFCLFHFVIWFISLSIMFSRFTHIVVCVTFSFLLWLSNTPLYVYTTFSLSIFFLWWTFALSILFGCYEQCCNQHACTCV